MHAPAGLCACRKCPWHSHWHRRVQRIEQEGAKLRPGHVNPHRDSMIHLLRTGNTHRPCRVQAESGQTLHTGLSPISPDAGAPAAAPNQAADPLINGWVGISVPLARVEFYKPMGMPPGRFNGEFLDLSQKAARGAWGGAGQQNPVTRRAHTLPALLTARTLNPRTWHMILLLITMPGPAWTSPAPR